MPLLPVKEVLVGSSPPAKHLFSRSGLGDGRLDEVSQLHPCPFAPHHHGVLSQEVYRVQGGTGGFVWRVKSFGVGGSREGSYGTDTDRPDRTRGVCMALRSHILTVAYFS